MNLPDWLQKIEQLHPVKWDLGLERVGEVGKRLGLLKPAPVVILVAGTNGKGSTCEYLQQLCISHSTTVGKASSPHFLTFNERIQVNGLSVGDDEICQAFAAIDSARGEISLSYFEFAALAALYVFKQQSVDVAILEVGLGGRLDAMNIVDPDVSVITKIALDHQSWLGDSISEIALEKGGITRLAKPCIVADDNPPDSLRQLLLDKSCASYFYGHQFEFTGQALWLTQDKNTTVEFDVGDEFHLPAPSLAAAVQAMLCAGFKLDPVAVKEVACNASLPGRMQWLPGKQRILLDVAHNPNAALYLKNKLERIAVSGVIHAVVGMYADKDYRAVLALLESTVSHWYFTDLDEPRAASAIQLRSCLSHLSGSAVQTYAKVSTAYESAVQALGEQDLLLVFGSFPVVAGVLAR